MGKNKDKPTPEPIIEQIEYCPSPVPPALERLTLFFFRLCKLATIAGAGTSVVVLLIDAINQTPDGTEAAISAGILSLFAFWLMDREVDKIENPCC